MSESQSVIVMIFGTLAQSSVSYEGQANIYWEGDVDRERKGGYKSLSLT